MGKIDYDLKIHKLSIRIAKLKKRKRFKEQKEKKEKRRERARKLLKLGLIFEFTMTDIYSIELITGYLECLKREASSNLEYYKYLGEKMLKEYSLERHDDREVIFLDTAERKARNHKLISLGALFEKTKTDHYLLSIQVGYVDKLHSLSNYEVESYKLIGKNILNREVIK